MSDLANTLIFESNALTVRSIAVSEMENNVYLLTHRASGGQVLIDAADDFPAINTFSRLPPLTPPLPTTRREAASAPW